MNDPLTFNQVIQKDIGLSTYQITNMLIKLGMPFKTLHRYSLSKQLMWCSPLVLTYIEGVPLGFSVHLWLEGPFTLEDYQAYLDQRDDII